MADQIKVRGMVISSSPIGENDKRVVLLTKEKGKISAFVRGARRPGNHLMAASDSFSFCASIPPGYFAFNSPFAFKVRQYGVSSSERW